MRIIKTAARNRAARSFFAAGMLLLAPAAALFTAGVMPKAVSYMTEAAKYTALPAADSGDLNNGSLILYTPAPSGDQKKTRGRSADRALRDEPEYHPLYTGGEDTGERAVSGENDMESASGNVCAAFLTRNIVYEKEDLSAFAANSGEIREVTFSSNAGPDHINLPGGGQIRNCTQLSAETVYAEAVKPHGIKIELYSDSPQVLILHTHTNESFEPAEKSYYDESYTCRSSDPDNSVVAVGTAIAEELASAGIAVLHDGTVHDGQYSGAYERSLNTACRLLAEFPSIKIILDIHRDAIEEEDGTRVSAVTEIDGKKAAQVMIISAADDGTYDIPRYLDNLRFAGALQQTMERLYPTLARPVLFQYCQYNQQLSTGSLLIEVGSHGNSIGQAVYSGRLIGRSLAAMFTDGEARPPAVICSVPRFFIDRLK